MDALDARILRALIWGQALWPLSGDPRTSFSAMARKLGVDEGTIRNRVRRSHRSGFISGWRTILNPSLVGGGEIAVWLDVGYPATQDEVLEAARLVPGAILLNRYHGKTLCIVLRYHDAYEAKLATELLLRIARAEWRVVGRIPFPACNLRLTATDRAVLRALHGDPRKPSATVARELGVSTRTVRRRLERLVEGRAVFAFPAPNPKAPTGTLMGGLFLTCAPDRKKEVDEAVRKRLEEHIWHVFHMLPYAPGGFHPTFYNLFLPNLAMAPEILRWAHDLPGVAECRLELVEDIETRFGIFDDELERLAAAT